MKGKEICLKKEGEGEKYREGISGVRNKRNCLG